MSATPTPPSNNEPNNPDNGKKKSTKDITPTKNNPSLSWLVRLLILLLTLFGLVCIALLYIIGTDDGTKFLINKVANETGINLDYGKGNFRDGLWVNEIKFTPSEDMNIIVDKAYVKIGWRAIFNQEIHLRHAEINNIYINSTKASSGEPFSYKKIDMPVNLRLDHATIANITYNQVNQNSLLFKEIEADTLNWSGTKLTVDSANLDFSYLNNSKQEKEIVKIKKLEGDINFNHDYPINATGIATIISLSDYHFDPIKIRATGSLKNLHGKLSTKYNSYPITADVDIQPVIDGAPLSGSISSKKFKLPYASDYDIKFNTSKIDVSGTWRELTFDIDSNINAINIPSGHYLGQAKWFTLDDKININKLTVDSKKGALNSTVDLNWQDSLVIDLQVKTKGYKLDEVLPSDFKDFKGYLPKSLDGSLGLKYQSKNKDNKMQIDATLNQKDVAYDGEFIEATIVSLADSNTDKSKKNNTPDPYSIDVNWRNLYRKVDPELDVHNIGIIDSDKGNAKIYIKGEYLTAAVDAQINKLSTAPKGNYELKLKRNASVIDIDTLNYLGDIGDLTASGQVTIPKKEGSPILWSMSGKTNGFSPIKYNSNIPVELITGNFSVSDVIKLKKPKKNTNRNHQNTQYHEITIKHANIKSILDSRSSREIGINGNGKFLFTLSDSGLNDFQVNYKGKIENKDLPKGNYQINAKGSPANININKLVYQGIEGKLSGSGKLVLEKDKTKSGENMRWQFNADVNEFNLDKFTHPFSVTPVALTGKINTSGNWFTPSTKENTKKQHKVVRDSTIKSSKIEGRLADFSLKFDGEILASKSTIPSSKVSKQQNEQVNDLEKSTVTTVQTTINIPTGKLNLEATGNRKNIKIDHIHHQGEAGFIDGKGSLDLKKGYQWQINADMKAFNLGFFYPAIASSLTGKIDTTGRWNHNQKQQNLTNFKIKFDGNIKTDSLPSGKLILDASSDKNDNKKIILNQVRHEGEAGFLDAKGVVNLTDGYQWQLTSKMKNFNIGYFIQDLPSSLSGNITTIGDWNKKYQKINISNMDVSGHLKNKPLSATGIMSADLTLPKNITTFIEHLKQSKANDQYLQTSNLIQSLNFQDVVAKWGDNILTANGNKDQLETSINIYDLYQLHDKLKGALTGTISLKADESIDNKNQPPNLYVDLHAEELSLPSFQLNHAKVKGKIVNFGNNESKLIINANELIAGSTKFKDIHAVFIGTENKHKLNLNIANDKVKFSGNLIGGLDNREIWKGSFSNASIGSEHLKLSQIQPSEMIANFKKAELKLAAHCWYAHKNSKNNKTDNDRKAKSSSKLCLNDNLILSKNKGNIDLTLQKIDTTLLSSFLPMDIEWKTKLSGITKVNWETGEKPDVEATLYSDNGQIGLRQEDDTVSYIPYQRVSVIGLTTSDGLKIRTDITSEGKGKAYFEATVDPFSKNKSIEGVVSIDDLKLKIFKPFFPGMRTLEGKGSMSGTISGTLKKPLINGDLKLTGVGISMLGMPINLSNINAIAKIRDTQSTLEGTFNMGEGKGNIVGTIDWKNNLQAKIGITGKQLNIVQPPLLSANVNPDINIIVKPLDKYVEIKGAISVPNAIIRPPEEDSTEIKTSADVMVLDRRQTGNIDEVLAMTIPWSINADVGLDLGDNVNFKGFGAELPLAGALIIRQRGQGKMTSKGVVQVARRSNIDAFGQSVELDYAQFRFNGDVTKPNLSIEASKKIQSSTVGFRVKGHISDPEITVFNDAGLTEQQAMNALVTGRLNNVSANQVSEEGFRSEVTNNLAAAGLSIGLDSTRDLTNQIGRAVGLQSLTLSASGNSEDTNVNVTGYITPDLYIRYGIGVFSARSQLSTRYQLTRNFYVEATSTTEKFIDLVYNWEF